VAEKRQAQLCRDNVTNDHLSPAIAILSLHFGESFVDARLSP
jgi:hypothetical protein